MNIAEYMGAGIYSTFLMEDRPGWSVEDRARFLGQCSVESAGFTRVEENLNYRAERLREIFGSRNGITNWQEVVNGGRKAIAEAIYGGTWGAKNLGNTEAGDGYKYRGGGLIQVTGRANYSKASKDMFGDLRLLERPEMIREPMWAARSAIWFYEDRGCLGITDVKVITRKVNGGYNHLTERIQETNRALQFLG